MALRISAKVTHNSLDKVADTLASIAQIVTGQKGFIGSAGNELFGSNVNVVRYAEREDGGQQFNVRATQRQGVLWRGASYVVLNRMMEIVQVHLRNAFPQQPKDAFGQPLGAPALGPYPRKGGAEYRGWWESYRTQDAREVQMTVADSRRRIGLVARATVESGHADTLMDGRKAFIAVNSPRIAEDADRKSWMVFRGKDGDIVFIPAAPTSVHKRTLGMKTPKKGPKARPSLAEAFYVHQKAVAPNPKWLRAVTALRSELDRLATQAERGIRSQVERTISDALNS